MTRACGKRSKDRNAKLLYHGRLHRRVENKKGKEDENMTNSLNALQCIKRLFGPSH